MTNEREGDTPDSRHRDEKPPDATIGPAGGHASVPLREVKFVIGLLGGRYDAGWRRCGERNSMRHGRDVLASNLELSE